MLRFLTAIALVFFGWILTSAFSDRLQMTQEWVRLQNKVPSNIYTFRQIYGKNQFDLFDLRDFAELSTLSAVEDATWGGETISSQNDSSQYKLFLQKVAVNYTNFFDISVHQIHGQRETTTDLVILSRSQYMQFSNLRLIENSHLSVNEGMNILGYHEANEGALLPTQTADFLNSIYLKSEKPLLLRQEVKDWLKKKGFDSTELVALQKLRDPLVPIQRTAFVREVFYSMNVALLILVILAGIVMLYVNTTALLENFKHLTLLRMLGSSVNRLLKEHILIPNLISTLWVALGAGLATFLLDGEVWWVLLPSLIYLAMVFVSFMLCRWAMGSSLNQVYRRMDLLRRGSFLQSVKTSLTVLVGGIAVLGSLMIEASQQRWKSEIDRYGHELVEIVSDPDDVRADAIVRWQDLQHDHKLYPAHKVLYRSRLSTSGDTRIQGIQMVYGDYLNLIEAKLTTGTIKGGVLARSDSGLHVGDRLSLQLGTGQNLSLTVSGLVNTYGEVPWESPRAQKNEVVLIASNFPQIQSVFSQVFLKASGLDAPEIQELIGTLQKQHPDRAPFIVQFPWKHVQHEVGMLQDQKVRLQKILLLLFGLLFVFIAYSSVLHHQQLRLVNGIKHMLGASRNRLFWEGGIFLVPLVVWKAFLTLLCVKVVDVLFIHGFVLPSSLLLHGAQWLGILLLIETTTYVGFHFWGAQDGLQAIKEEM